MERKSFRVHLSAVNMHIQGGWALLAIASCACAAEPALTLYNRNFAVVRESVPVELKAGDNTVRFSDATFHLEPNSVVLRDPAGRANFQILEQNFIAEPISQAYLLSLMEGKVLDFEVPMPNGEKRRVKGKLIRAGYVPHTAAYARASYAYVQRQQAMAYQNPGTATPVVESEGQILFRLPGEPVFPALSQEAILKPTLVWKIAAPQAVKFDAELSYLSGGFNWDADYNLILAGDSDVLDAIGWVTLDNQSGRSFQNAVVKLVAGDVQRLEDNRRGDQVYAMSAGLAMQAGPGQPQVTERSFDDYHLYTLERRVNLADRETKQVEFLRTNGVRSTRRYVYDGRTQEQRAQYGSYTGGIDNPNWGLASHGKVAIVREVENTTGNHLGVPLPAGRVKFYRRDRDGRLEFIGEAAIQHTPRNEKVKMYTGNAFDLVGERRRTQFMHANNMIDEAFEIKVTNRKTEQVSVQVLEHLDRFATWTMLEQSQNFNKLDASTISFDVSIPANGEVTVRYKVHYSW